MLAFAGVTYTATRIFDESEEAYVKALHITSRTNSLNLSDGLVECIFPGLFNTYVNWSCNAEDDPLAEQVSLVRMIALLSSQGPVSHSTRTL
jgi:hypothetical protein